MQSFQTDIFSSSGAQAKGLTVYRASAGSGKTYTLTLEYLKKALSSPANPYRFGEILAVTFTNKATDEMKQRIIGALNSLVDGGEPDMAREICRELNINGEALRIRAAKVRKAILHNYSRFSISTIDGFFQKIIHAFVREAGLRPGFRLELDHDRVMNEAVDRMMTGLHLNKFLYGQLFRVIEGQMELGRNWDVRKTLTDRGGEVLKERFRSFEPEFHKKICDAGFMAQYAAKIDEIIDCFDEQMLKYALQAQKVIADNSLTVASFRYGKGGAANYFYKTANGKYSNEEYEPGKRVLDILETGEWFDKKNKNNPQHVADSLSSILGNMLTLYNAEYSRYCTALCIKKMLHTLIFMAEIEAKIRETGGDENIMLISETTGLLGALIGESDAPFVYEKAGSRYSIFMIDEFQDTSEAQWHNFRPLLKNSLAENSDSLVVGDIKQSIYRWRNGDWRILAKKIHDDFRSFNISEKTLGTNWRSFPAVIWFNNALFASLPAFVENLFASSADFPETASTISLAYGNTEQDVSPKNMNKCGYVCVSETRDTDGQKAVEKILDRLPLLVAEIQDRGYRAGDIAILVRKGVEGQRVSDCLLNYKETSGDTEHCFDILSQDSLYLNASDDVNFIMATLRAVVSQDDRINNAAINRYLSNGTNFSGELDDTVRTFFAGLKSLSLPEIFEQITAKFVTVNSNIHYIQELHDLILSFSNGEISDISAFIEYWDGRGDKQKLSAVEAADAINIQTIHKAKGLEYPVVIIPFCNWEMKPDGDTVWVSPKEYPFSMLEHVPVPYGNIMKNSLFGGEYSYETVQSLVDNLNLMYVAFTRAREELHIMLPLPKIPKSDSSKSDPLSNAAKVLSQFLADSSQFPVDRFRLTAINSSDDSCTIYTVGEKCQRHAETRGGVSPHANSGLRIDKYVSSPFKKRLRLKYDAADCFQSTGIPSSKPQKYGVLMHRVFSRINSVKDVSAAIASIEDEGYIARKDIPELKAHIEKALAYAGEWFADNGKYTVITERFILLPLSMNLGASRKPDRVMSFPDETIVIDYKFGSRKEESHRAQTAMYINLLKKMNYPNVKGYIWYVDLMETVAIL
ncbi:MAG: UvrD-helicase domain-containing protein [Prevotellaceae bacterium]|jgi:ATP-dependent exoDNAse (exonuclease V) beta subunit|nr:UvrD-helicase domain-containing protein [Prevotellaceae bacterium]